MSEPNQVEPARNRAGEDVSQRVRRGKRRLLMIIVLAGALVVSPVIVWAWMKNQDRPDFDPDAARPTITHGTDRAVDEDDPNADEEHRRGSVTDLFLDHPLDDAEHPLEPALLVARQGLDYIRENIRDYTAVVTKRERVRGRLLDEEHFVCKIRHANTDPQTGEAVPLSMYLRFVNPRNIAGREVIWVEGRNRGNLIAHEPGGIVGWFRAELDPTGMLAMRGNRYPITELGMKTLIVRMIERGERSREDENCQVTIDRSVELNGNPCTLITIRHPERIDGVDFYLAKVYIDDTLNLPVGYESYLWPEKPGGEPRLLESYFYSDIQVNVGLTDRDFDPDNSDYNFP